MAGRRCPGKDEHDGRSATCPVVLTNGERYCPRHQQAYDLRRGTATARGYGADHRTLRAEWQRSIDAGEVVTCARCGEPIASSAWALDHTDDRRGYLGPSHKRCNDAAGGRAAHRWSNER